jgi:hypothetical protein
MVKVKVAKQPRQVAWLFFLDVSVPLFLGSYTEMA